MQLSAPNRNTEIVGRARTINCLLLALALGAVCGCSSFVNSNDALLTRIANRGPIALSSQNPYLAANLYLSRELQDNPDLAGFVRLRGAPAAIAVNQSVWDSSLLIFFYPENNERYNCEKTGKQWYITGPEPMSREEIAAVQESIKGKSGQAKLMIDGKVFSAPRGETARRFSVQGKFKSSSESAQGSTAVGSENKISRSSATTHTPVTPAPDALLRITPMPTPALLMNSLRDEKLSAVAKAISPSQVKTAVAAKKVAEKKPLVAPPAAIFPPVVKAPTAQKLSNEEILTRLKKLVEDSTAQEAESSPRGDIVHYVIQAEEQLESIALWYTFDSQNTERLSRINALAVGLKLSPGDTIIVPSYLVKNKKILDDASYRNVTVLVKK